MALKRNNSHAIRSDMIWISEKILNKILCRLVRMMETGIDINDQVLMAYVLNIRTAVSLF
jgi:hypothetical protein